MDRNTTIAFILIGAILIGWLYMNAPEPPKDKGKDSDTTLVKSDTTGINKLPEKETVLEEEIIEDEPSDVEEQDSLAYGKYFHSASGDEKIITIENDLFLMELTDQGANIRKFYLKKYNNWYSADENGNGNIYKNSVQLINYSLGDSYNLSFISTDGKAINTANLKFETDINKSRIKLSGDDSLSVTFTYEVDENSRIVKNFIFFGNKYSFKNQFELIGMNNLISNNAYDLVWDNGIRFVEKNSVDEANYSNASVYYGGEQVIVDADDPDETVEEDFSGRINWIAVRNKYFASIISPDNPDNMEGAYIKGYRNMYPPSGVREFYSVRLIIPFQNTDYQQRSFTVYIGPVDYSTLAEYNRSFEAIVDFGSFFGLKFIIRPIAEYLLLPLFTFLHTFIPNYGFVIIVFSLIIKFVLYPLTKKSYQSMKKMQQLQPLISEIKEKYKDDPQKMNKETMKLYSTYGVNPAGGCLPLVLQMPIFIALWGLFQTAIELRQQPFIWWIQDLSRPDVIFDLGFSLPIIGIDKISGLALLMGITTFVQQKMTMKDPKQAAMVYIMPIFLTLLFMSFPSGLNLYYFTFNLFSIAQQYYINHKHDDAKLEPVKNPKKKKGFMAKMMEAAEQQAKTQQKRRR